MDKLTSYWKGTTLPAAPKLKQVIITCMDARIDPLRILGLDLGDVHILRNAGGVITQDTIRSIIISQRYLNTTSIVIIQHTSCGLLSFKDEEIKDELEQKTGIKPDFCFEPFENIEANLIQSVKRLQASPFIYHKDNISAYVLNIDSGELELVYPK